MNLIEELKLYQSQQLENELLSDQGRRLVNFVINECIKIASKHTDWKSPNEPPDTDREVLILYKDVEPLDKDNPFIGQDISSYREERLGGRPLGYSDWYPPFEYFRGNYEIIGWKELEY